MKHVSTGALALVLCLSGTLPVFAQDPGPEHHGHHGPGAMMERVDTNGDGKIDRNEAKGAPRLAEHFDRIDANGDGSLDKAELDKAHEHHRAGRRERGAERFEESDTNGDGAIDLAEAKAAAEKRAEQMFGKMDADGDGKLTREEMNRYAPPPPPPVLPPPPKR